MEFFKQKDLNTFANLIVKMDGAEFIGLAKVLCVPVFKADAVDIKGKPAPRKAEDIITDCLTAFAALNREKRREVLKIVKAVVGKGGK
jgi:hypothetical protein